MRDNTKGGKGNPNAPNEKRKANCLRDLESVLSAHYELYSQAYVGVQMKKLKKESEDTE